MAEAREFDPSITPVVDTDFHFSPPPEKITPFVENSRARRDIERYGFPRAATGGWNVSLATPGDDAPGKTHGVAHDRGDVIAAKEELQFDEVVLTPGGPIIALATAKYPALKNQIVSAYNDYLLEEVLSPADGIYGNVIVPLWDATRTVEELDRVGDADGVTGAQYWYGPWTGPGSSEYDPVYRKLSDLDKPLAFHLLGGSNRFTLLEDSRQTHVEHLAANSSHAMSFVLNMVCNGVFDTFSDLRVVVQEAGISWIPFVKLRSDEIYQNWSEDFYYTDRMRDLDQEYLRMMPSRYITKHFNFTTQPISLPANQQHVKALLELCDATESLMFSSDWPHHSFDPLEWIGDYPVIDEEMRSRILAGNAREIYSLE